MDPELAVGTGQVRFDGPSTDEKTRGNVGIRQPLRSQLSDSLLAFRQIFGRTVARRCGLFRRWLFRPIVGHPPFRRSRTVAGARGVQLVARRAGAAPVIVRAMSARARTELEDGRDVR